MTSDSTRGRGVLSEQLVAAALSKLKEEGLIDDYVWLSMYSGKAASDLEKGGVDFILVRRRGLGLPLQVKTSPKHAVVHRKKYKDIPVVTVGQSQQLIIAEERTRAVISATPDTLWQKEWHAFYVLLVARSFRKYAKKEARRLRRFGRN